MSIEYTLLCASSGYTPSGLCIPYNVKAYLVSLSRQRKRLHVLNDRDLESVEGILMMRCKVQDEIKYKEGAFREIQQTQIDTPS